MMFEKFIRSAVVTILLVGWAAAAQTPTLSDLWNGSAYFKKDLDDNGRYDTSVSSGRLMSIHFATMVWNGGTLYAYYNDNWPTLSKDNRGTFSRAHSTDGVYWIYDGVAVYPAGHWWWQWEAEGGGFSQLTANGTLIHNTGRAESDGWSASVGDAAGYLVAGPRTTSITAGERCAEWRLMCGSTIGTNQVATLDVYDTTAGKVLASGNLSCNNFGQTNSYYDFALDFDAPGANHQLEFRTYWYGAAYLKQDLVGVAQSHSTAWDYAGIIDSVGVAKDAQGNYQLVYAGSPSRAYTGSVARDDALGLATSTDGLNFTKYAGNPILFPSSYRGSTWDRQGIGTPSVVYGSDGNWYLFYHAWDGQFPWNGTYGSWPWGQAYGHCQIGVASGTCLTNLTPYAYNPILPAVTGTFGAGTLGRRSTLMEDGPYRYMAYEVSTAAENFGYGASDWSSALARSPQYGPGAGLFSWQKYAGNPVITPTADGMGQDGPEMVQFNGQNYLYVRNPLNTMDRYTLAWKGAAIASYPAEGPWMRHASQFGFVADGWRATLGNQPGWLTYFLTAQPSGPLTAQFWLKVDNNTNDNAGIAYIDVLDNDAGVILASRELYRMDWSQAGVYKAFGLSFMNPKRHAVQCRVYYRGGARLDHQRTDILQNIVKTVEVEDPGNSHALGQAIAGGWRATVSQTNGYMTYGPGVTDVPSGKFTANFWLAVDNHTNDNAKIATVDVLGWARRASDGVWTNWVLASTDLRRQDWTADNNYQPFQVDFTNRVEGWNWFDDRGWPIEEHKKYEFRVFYYGSARLDYDKVDLVASDSFVPLAGVTAWNLAGDFTNATASPGFAMGMGPGATNVYDGPVACGSWTFGRGNKTLTLTSVLDAYDPNGWGNSGLNTWYCAGIGYPAVAHNTTSATIANRLAPSSIMLQPYLDGGLTDRGSQVFVQWVAPSNGLYAFNLNWNFNDSNADGVIAAVYKNGNLPNHSSGPAPAQLAAWTLTTQNQTASWSTRIAMSAGENLMFAITPNNTNSGNWGACNTLIDLKITTPSVPGSSVAMSPIQGMDVSLYPGIAVTGTVGGHYQVQYATALTPTNWFLLQDIPNLPFSLYTVYDSAPCSSAQRFYRAVQVP